MISKFFFLFTISCLTVLSTSSSCNKKSNAAATPTPVPPLPPATSDMAFWLTAADQSALLQKQNILLSFGTQSNAFPFIDVDDTQVFQTVDGFGFTLTSGSAQLINTLPSATRTALLMELFGKDDNAIGISYLRISIGASDLSDHVYSYDDLSAGQTDEPLANFTLAPDMDQLIRLLKDITAINPALKILATPWSPPVWMKDNGSSVGGSLLPQYYGTYASYFVKYIQQMQVQGLPIDAITPQNEPLHPGNNPSMYMTAAQQANFIKNNLGPAFQAAGVKTKIIVYDHNADRPDYPLSILNDAAAINFINGSAFHLYAGDISALSQVHDAHPDKQVYFTEQYTASNGNFGGDLKWHLKNIVIGSMRNWSRVALEWNLANDASFGPHTPGGCTTCKGAITIGSGITRNVAYYIIAHASKFVPAGSVRVSSNNSGSLQTVAFKTGNGNKVLIVENDGTSGATFNIRYHSRWVTVTLAAGGVGTFTW